MKSKNSDLKTLKLLLKTINKIDISIIPLLLLNVIFKVGDSFINIFVPMIFINGFEAGWLIKKFFYIVVLLIVVKILLSLLLKLLDREVKIKQEKLYIEFPQAISKKSMDLSYEKLEDPKLLDLKERALFPITSFGAVSKLVVGITGSVASFLTLFGSFGILISFSIPLALVSIGLSFLVVFQYKKFSVVAQEISQSLIPINRKYGYYVRLMANADYQKEIRIFNMQDMIMARSNSYIFNVLAALKDFHKKMANSETIIETWQTILRFVSYSYGAVRVLSKSFGPQIGIGYFSLVIGANESFMTNFANVFHNLFDVKMAIKHLQPFAEFMELEENAEAEGQIELKEIQTLEFKDVTFTYPNTDRKILDKLSFKINKGEKISIVGINNSGKSTIVKLICRFFKVDSGSILVNGIEIEKYNKEKYMEKIACVFQDFSLFPLSIKENIIANKAEDENKLKATIAELDLENKLLGLPSKLDTKINKSIYDDATDFSGGEKQKIAIARALYRNGDLVILDEPTAALDPLAEAEIYENFNELVEGKTTIFISHRMSSSKFCDKVLLIDKGKLVSFASHKELMEDNNLYKDLYEAQAKYFKEKN